MSAASLDEVQSHWCKLVEGFETSPLSFYAAVEAALQRRLIPGVRTARVSWNEGGALSPQRLYLRITGGRYCADICAAPFGTGFFFSSWETKRKASFAVLHLLAIAVAVAVLGRVLDWLASGLIWHVILSLQPVGEMAIYRRVADVILVYPLATGIVLWAVALLARAGRTETEAAVLTVPLVGMIYQRIFAPATYYRLDTEAMFRTAVHAAVMEAVNEQLSGKGLRALSEDEQRPEVREFWKR